MAGVPNVFLPQTTIKSSEVNENFNAILGALLSVTGLDSATWLKDFVIGKRSNMLISGAADSGSAPAYKFLQLGWNTNFINMGGGVWKLSRFNDGESATMIRIGANGFRVMLTSQTAGNLDTQMNTGFAVSANSGGADSDYVYIPSAWNIVHNETTSPSHSDLRMTLTLFDDPVSLSAAVATSAGSTSVNVHDYGVPTWAKAVLISMHVLASSSGCFYKVYQERGSRVTTFGFSQRMSASQWDGQQGVVPLGRAGNKGKIVFDRSASVAQQTIVIVGYYT